MRKTKQAFGMALTLAAVLLMARCAPPIAGNTSETGNGKIASMLYNPGGTPAVGVVVYIRPDSTLADTSLGLPATAGTDSTVTDNNGNYSFDTSLDAGTYVIEAASGNNAVLIDSVVVTAGPTPDTLPPDTLKPAGAIKGVVYLSEGGDPRKVFVLAFGIDRFAHVNADGSFKFSSLARGAYDLRLISSLDDYDVLDTVGVPVLTADTTDLGTIELPYTGIPVPRGLQIQYDTLKQIVTLYWNTPTTGRPVQSYNVYRRNVDSNTVLARLNASPVTDTSFTDSMGVQDMTYEYQVAVVDTSTSEGVKSAGVNVLITSAYHLIDSVYHFGTGVGQFYDARCIAVDSFGNIYIGDASKNEVLKYDSLSNFITSMNVQNPVDIRTDSANNVYVASYDDNKIYKFNSSGDSLLSWGGTGTDTGKFTRPNRIYIHSNNIYVCEEGNSRIQIFNLEGNYITQFTHTEGFNYLRGVCIVDSDIIVLSSFAIYQFNPAYVYQNTILSWSPLTDYAAWFSNLGDSLFIYFSLSQKINHFDLPSKTTISTFNLQSKPITLHSFMVNKDKKMYLVSTTRVYIYSF
jgi:hypothetical protein